MSRRIICLRYRNPTAEVCPTCGSTLFNKGGAKGKLVCHKEGCGYERDMK